MKLGVLDIGSNTIHLLAVDAHPGASPTPTYSYKNSVRLMRFIDSTGAINADGRNEILSAVKAAVKDLPSLKLDAFITFATSALREASNGPLIVHDIENITGQELQILSGEDEARLTFLAVRRWLGWSAGSILLFDIGGGSLELAQGSDEYPELAVSVPLGAARSTVNYFSSDPPSTDDVNGLITACQNHLNNVSGDFLNLKRPNYVVGSSKTIRSLAKLAGSVTKAKSKSGGFGLEGKTKLSLNALSDWAPRLCQLPASSRPALPGITEDRAFQIAAGAVVLEQAMRALKVEHLEVSPWALREGVIMRYIDSLNEF